MRDINAVAKKMARNGLKIANSLGCAFHFESEFKIVWLIDISLDITHSNMSLMPWAARFEISLRDYSMCIKCWVHLRLFICLAKYIYQCPGLHSWKFY